MAAEAALPAKGSLRGSNSDDNSNLRRLEDVPEPLHPPTPETNPPTSLPGPTSYCDHKCRNKVKLPKDADMQTLIQNCLANENNCPKDFEGKPDMNCWDTSEVTSMWYAFKNQKEFDDSIECWDTSSVTNMSGMFQNAQKFNQNIGHFDVSKVTSMSSMFQHANQFSQDLEYWDTSKVESMANMFALAENFNRPLEKWDVSKVTSMYRMFQNAQKFNQPLSKWKVSSVTNMQEMFRNAISFNQNVNQWDVSRVTGTDMWGNVMSNMMFHGATSYDQCLSAWESKNFVYDHDSMFVNTKCPKYSFGHPKYGEVMPWCCRCYEDAEMP